jgi:hypothetical protein
MDPELAAPLAPKPLPPPATPLVPGIFSTRQLVHYMAGWCVAFVCLLVGWLVSYSVSGVLTHTVDYILKN